MHRQVCLSEIPPTGAIAINAKSKKDDMAKDSICAGCRRNPFGAFAPVKQVSGRWYCTDCADKLEPAPSLAAVPTPVKADPPTRDTYSRFYCTNCQTRPSHAVLKGNGWIEFVLYLFYILPGVVYSIWRRSGPPNGCPTCGNATLIPAEAAEVSPDTHVKCPDCAELVKREARKCKHCGCALIPQ